MSEENKKISFKREHLSIMVLALVVLGFVVGRASAPDGAVVDDKSSANVKVAHGTAKSGDAGKQATASASTPAVSPGVVKAPSGEAKPVPPVVTKAPSVAKAPSTPKAAPPTAAAPIMSIPAGPPPQTWRVTLHKDDAVKGAANAPVTIVVFSAFGCQVCTDFKPALDRILAEYPGKVKVVFKHKTFNAPHPDALIASQGALAAKAQGKFWEMYDKLFAAGFSIERASLERYASELGLDLRQFQKDLDAEKFRPQVLRDSLLANEVGAHSFPNILANGVRIKKPKNYESLKALVDQELARAKQLMDGGTPLGKLYNKAIAGGKAFPQLGPPKSAFSTVGSGSMGPAKGKEKVELVVFEDFECPFCAKNAPNLKIFQNRFPKRVRLVFKHFPLNSIHPNAQLASEAALAAKAQGKFWEMHDKIYANQKSLTKEDLVRYAKELGLNMAKFNTALETRQYKPDVERDARDGRTAGIRSTPTVLLNGRQYQGPRGMDPMGLEAVSRQYLGL
jgi:protein-disulfide isomerase